MTGADVEHSAQIKFNGVILHAIDACDVRRREPRRRQKMSYTGRARQASQEEDGPGEAARLRPPARLREVPADVHGLHLLAVFLVRVVLLPVVGRKET